MEHSRKEDALRVAELLKGFAYLALVVFFVDGIIDFVNTMRFEGGFGGFIAGLWQFVKALFRMGVLYLCLLGAAHVILLLVDIKAGEKSPQG